MKMSAILIAAVALGATAPVLAASGDSSDRFKLIYDAKHDKYCTSQEVTGSHLPLKDCRTKDEWAKAGTVFPDKAGAKLASK